LWENADLFNVKASVLERVKGLSLNKGALYMPKHINMNILPEKAPLRNITPFPRVAVLVILPHKGDLVSDYCGSVKSTVSSLLQFCFQTNRRTA
jgi:hypothetical protein